MNHTITTTMEHSIYTFLDEQSKVLKKPKKYIIEEALRLYQKNQLKAQIEVWLDERYWEFKTINKDFSEVQLNSIKI